MIDLTQKSDEELEDILFDLLGRLELDAEEVELLQAVEEERERRGVVRMEQRKCPYCGKPNPPDVTRCIHCLEVIKVLRGDQWS